MKKNLSKIGITIITAMILAVGVSYVSVLAAPTATPSAMYQQDLPLHTAGAQYQKKHGGIFSQRFLGAPIALFREGVFLPGSQSALRVGSTTNNPIDLNSAIFNNQYTEPLVIDLNRRSSPAKAMRFTHEGQLCTVATRFVNDKSNAFEFRNNSEPANIIARQIQLTGGEPDNGKILVSDTAGNARWAKATVVNGVVKFSTDSTSPVPAGQCTSTTCTDPSATNYNQVGACTYPTRACGGVLEKIRYNNGEINENYTANAKLYYKATAPVADRCKIVANGGSVPSGYTLASQSQALDNGECTWFDKTPYTDPIAGDMHTFSSTGDCPINCPAGQYNVAGQCLCNSTDLPPGDSNPLNRFGEPTFDYFELDANMCPLQQYRIKTTICNSPRPGVAGTTQCHEETPSPYSPSMVLLKASQAPIFSSNLDQDGHVRSSDPTYECAEMRLSYYVANEVSYPFGFHQGQYSVMGPSGDTCSDWKDTGEYIQETRREVVPVN